MQKINIKLVKSFTKDKEQGNPVGVIFDTEKLLPMQMMNIVEKTGFSECAFVQRSDVADIKVRFFSPKKEVNLCGHATIATFHLLQKKLQKKLFIQETLSGILKVVCHDDGLIEMEQQTPTYYDKEYEIDFVAKILGINALSIVSQPIKVSTGTPKLLVKLDSIETLWNLKPDFDAIKEHIPSGIYPFFEGKTEYYSRQFNPSTGIDEDPVTGVAAGALGAYLKKYADFHKPFIVEQGHILGKVGRIYVDATSIIKVGGYAVEFGELELEI